MSATATDTKAPLRLATMSEHHMSGQWTTPLSELTANAWVNASVATGDEAKLRPPECIDVRIYRLARDASGEWECIVRTTIEKQRAYGADTATSFHRFDKTDGTLLDAFMRGEGGGARLRDVDAQRMLAIWASTVNPTPEAARNAARALTIRCAIRRGVRLNGWEAV